MVGVLRLLLLVNNMVLLVLPIVAVTSIESDYL